MAEPSLNPFATIHDAPAGTILDQEVLPSRESLMAAILAATDIGGLPSRAPDSARGSIVRFTSQPGRTQESNCLPSASQGAVLRLHQIIRKLGMVSVFDPAIARFDECNAASSIFLVLIAVPRH